MKRVRSQLGVSLVELLVALGILAVALTPLLRLFLHAIKTAEYSNKKMIAMNLARDIQEEIRSKEFADPSYPSALGGASTVGLETADGYSATKTRLLLDDVDDYNHWCRGQDCTECVDGTAYADLCVDNSALEAYDGTQYRGKGYPHYLGFTRRVKVYNIYRDVTDKTNGDPPEHDMLIGKNAMMPKKFKFYNLQEANFPNLTGGAAGLTRLKVVEVMVTYRGPVTPDINIEDTALVTLPIGQE